MGAAVAVAVMRRKEEEIREEFHKAGAIRPLDAQSLEGMGVGENRTLHRLMNRSVVREAQPGLYYFDEEVWQSVRATRRRMALLMLTVIVLVGLLVTYGVVTFQ